MSAVESELRDALAARDRQVAVLAELLKKLADQVECDRKVYRDVAERLRALLAETERT